MRRLLFSFFFLLSFSFLSYAEISKSSLEVILFFSPSCKHCLLLKKEFLPELKEKYKDKVRVVLLNVKKEENLKLLFSLAKKYNKRPAVPAVFFADKLLIGRRTIEQKLPPLIDNFVKWRQKYLFIKPVLTKSVEEEFKGFSFLSIILAGLVDGVNPCAFTVVIFFVSFLSFYGYRLRPLVIIGSFYILAVFITYFLIGIGIFKFLYQLDTFYILMKIFYYSMGAFCFVLGFLSLYDYFRYRKTRDASRSILQLPRSIKRLINKVIGDEFRGKSQFKKGFFALVLGALTVGFLVSILEALCTGQVYLPVISLVLKSPHLRLKALFYLLLYNLMFIIPLVIVFVLTLSGISSTQFSRFLKTRFGLIRILMAVLFFIFGIMMVWG